MIDALTKCLGIVTKACEVVGISRQTHYNWYNNDPEYKSAVDDIGDIALDFAESMLHQQIKEKDTTAIIFYLKTKGKKRGYIERSELDIAGELAINPVEGFKITIDDLSDKDAPEAGTSHAGAYRSKV